MINAFKNQIGKMQENARKCKEMNVHFLVDSHFEIWGPTLVPISS
jgi:hypothetical protein